MGWVDLSHDLPAGRQALPQPHARYSVTLDEISSFPPILHPSNAGEHFKKLAQLYHTLRINMLTVKMQGQACLGPFEGKP